METTSNKLPLVTLKTVLDFDAKKQDDFETYRNKYCNVKLSSFLEPVLLLNPYYKIPELNEQIKDFFYFIVGAQIELIEAQCIADGIKSPLKEFLNSNNDQIFRIIESASKAGDVSFVTRQFLEHYQESNPHLMNYLNDTTVLLLNAFYTSLRNINFEEYGHDELCSIFRVTQANCYHILEGLFHVNSQITGAVCQKCQIAERAKLLFINDVGVLCNSCLMKFEADEFLKERQMDAPTTSQTNVAPATSKTQSEESNCFVITATMGDASHPVVQAYRQYRDTELLSTTIGRFMISVYYKVGPILAIPVRQFKIIRFLSLKLLVNPLHRMIVNRMSHKSK